MSDSEANKEPEVTEEKPQEQTQGDTTQDGGGQEVGPDAAEEALQGKVTELNKANDGLATAVKAFEEASAAAAKTSEKHMGPKKPGPADPKKDEELKKSIREYGEAGKGVIAAVQEQQGVLNGLKALMESDLEEMRDMDEADKPSALRAQVEAMKEEVQRMASERNEAEEQWQKQMEEIQQECNKEKEQMVEQHVTQVNEMQRNIEAITDEKEITAQKLVVEQETVAHLKDVISERDKKITELIANCDRLEAEAAISAQSAKEFKQERDVLQAELKVSETSRSNEAIAYSKAKDAHAAQIENLEKKIADGLRQVEVAKTEKEAMRARLVDDHLREHIRLLQEENNQLREDKINWNHELSKRQTAGADVTGVLSAQITEHASEREKLERQIKKLTEEAAVSDKVIFTLNQQLDTQRSSSQATIETLSTQLQREKLAGERSASVQSEASRATTATTAAVSAKRTVHTQATDDHWKQLERDLICAKATNLGLGDRVDAMERLNEEQRRSFEAKLLSEAEQSSQEIHSLSAQLKSAKYKNSKMNQQLQVASERAASVPANINDVYQVADEKLIERCQKLEKQAVEATLEVESLKIRLRAVTREARDNRTNAALGDQLREELSPSRSNSARGVSQMTAEPTSPYTTALVEKAKERAQKQADIDQQLLALHDESCKLDAKEAVVQDRRATSETQIRDRVNWLDGAILYWSSSEANQQGPNGETKEQMVVKLQTERRDLGEQLQQVERGITKFFQEVSERRSKLFQQSSELLQQRSTI